MAALFSQFSSLHFQVRPTAMVYVFYLLGTLTLCTSCIDPAFCVCRVLLGVILLSLYATLSPLLVVQPLRRCLIQSRRFVIFLLLTSEYWICHKVFPVTKCSSSLLGETSRRCHQRNSTPNASNFWWTLSWASVSWARMLEDGGKFSKPGRILSSLCKYLLVAALW